MKRIHLFEFEDLPWFPEWIRTCMTRLLNVMHRFLGSREDLVLLLTKIMERTGLHNIIDLCSGSGGPMPEVFTELQKRNQSANSSLLLTDLYPDLGFAAAINQTADNSISYRTAPVDATQVGPELTGIRTMVCSFHHMPPAIARGILQDAQRSRQPICIYEISDNSSPALLWWISIPVVFIMAFFITPFARPLTWRQLLFTYLIPIIPLCFAWDGAVSNARTYTLQDLDGLLDGLQSADYTWEKGVLTGKAKRLYLLGLPA
ncbi:hypothetical protein D3Y59_00650 [Hymenobacter oligotrophus]|uniref:Class I SAM-dependent methyltransferase n=1 Tax=Hymenobacter oligotrophus TaxID=2319843 RepID=A0A3B7R4M7_9BACT|nr:hypothetical protein [Hymenobacter oligotrophus]AYA38732.1 hypothetical protein D3Y59_00650 [Hymenobacter oligotrophus]